MSARTIVAIGGGELKERQTLAIDTYLARLAKEHAGAGRARALFLPTASHDCMPYYNTFHKVYTGLFDLKTDVALTVGREVDPVRLRDKFEKADLIYVGGGDTVYMLGQWRACGMLPLLEEAYRRGTILCGLSAGAICWFERMYSDSVVEGEYAMFEGLGWLKGIVTPHYDERREFDRIVQENGWRAWGLENGAALEFVDETPVRALDGGGKVYLLDAMGGTLRRDVFPGS